MNKAEMIEKIATEADLSKKDAEKALSAFLSSVGEALKKGEKVQLIGFGTFEVRKRAARTARNPQTGEEIRIKGRSVPAFKPGGSLKSEVAEGK